MPLEIGVFLRSYSFQNCVFRSLFSNQAFKKYSIQGLRLGIPCMEFIEWGL